MSYLGNNYYSSPSKCPILSRTHLSSLSVQYEKTFESIETASAQSCFDVRVEPKNHTVRSQEYMQDVAKF